MHTKTGVIYNAPYNSFRALLVHSRQALGHINATNVTDIFSLLFYRYGRLF